MGAVSLEANTVETLQDDLQLAYTAGGRFGKRFGGSPKSGESEPRFGTENLFSAWTEQWRVRFQPVHELHIFNLSSIQYCAFAGGFLRVRVSISCRGYKTGLARSDGRCWLLLMVIGLDGVWWRERSPHEVDHVGHPCAICLSARLEDRKRRARHEGFAESRIVYLLLFDYFLLSRSGWEAEQWRAGRVPRMLEREGREVILLW